MVELINITKKFGGKTVVENLSLTVREGEIFTLLGESGCGKTTLLRMIAGFTAPDAGQIIIGGEDVRSWPVEKRPVGSIFQNYALFPHLTVYGNVAVGPRVRKLSETEVAFRVNSVLDKVRLADCRDAYPRELSGGQCQRVAIARAVVNEPKILLLDEPLSALDPKLRRSLRDELVEMQRALGATFLLVTHDREEALYLAHRLGVMADGRILQTGAPAELYDRPASPYVARFLGDVNQLDGTVESANASRLWVRVENVGVFACDDDAGRQPGAPVKLCIRPEKIYISAKGRPGMALNELRGSVVRSAYHGSYSEYSVILPNGAALLVRSHHGAMAQPRVEARAGDEVSLMLNISDLFMLEHGPTPYYAARM